MNVALPDQGFPFRLRFDIPLTEDELLRFCAANDPLRIEQDANGELIVMSPTGSEGGGTELEVGADLLIWARQDGRGRAFGPNAGFTLPDGSVRAADAAWISWSRWNAVKEDARKKFAPICPEFVIELRSESDRLEPLREKMLAWLANGCELAWLIDPSRKAVEVYRPNQQSEIQEGHSAAYGEGSVAGFVLDLARIWS
jgi:Uma2 family endonuclease